MNVAIIYCYPTINRPIYDGLARRFSSTYQQHPPGKYPHSIYVVVNGPMHNDVHKLFSPLPIQVMQGNNIGKDLGAYELAARLLRCDLMLCFGAPVFFHRAGWLDWIVDQYLTNGPGFYGAFAYQVPRPHIRTTCFWCPPELVAAYPYPVSNNTRYECEHGENSYSLWANRSGWPTYMVTWDGVYDINGWHQAPKSKCLMIDQHVDKYHGP